MEQNEILEGNKLIAEFMGYRKLVDTSLLTDDKSELILIRDNPLGILWWDKIEYHSSWDALMPVYKKLRDTAFATNDPIYTDVRMYITGCILECDIEATFEAIVKCIEIVNSQTTQS